MFHQLDSGKDSQRDGKSQTGAKSGQWNKDARVVRGQRRNWERSPAVQRRVLCMTCVSFKQTVPPLTVYLHLDELILLGTT